MENVNEIYRIKKFAISIGCLEIDSIIESQNYLGEQVTKLKIDNGVIAVIGEIGINSINESDNILFWVGEPITNSSISKISDYRDAIREFTQFDGAFVALYFDHKNKKLVIVNDFLGYQPLYYCHSDTKIIFANETKAFGCQRDLAGWGAFFSWGHLIGNRTLVKNVKKVSHGSVIIIDTNHLKIKTQRYWEFPETTSNYKISDIIETFKSSVLSYLKKTDQGHLLLSGGFDSRFILSTLKEIGISPKVLIVSHDEEYGNLDGKIAEKCANMSGVSIEKYKIEDNFFSSNSFLEYVALSDAQTICLFLFISKLTNIIRKAAPIAIWDGLIPDKLLKNPHYSGGLLNDFILQNTFSKKNPIWQVASQIFKNEIFEEMYESYLNDLNIERNNYSDDEVGAIKFNLLNRGARRIAINPLQVYANFARPFVPGMSKDFVNSTISIPFIEKKSNKLYFKIFKEIHPNAHTLPFLSGNELFFTSIDSNVILSKLRIKYFNFLTKHPSIFLKLGLFRPTTTNRSDFLLSKQLFDDTDINSDYLNKIDENDPNYKLTLKILFHWKVWELLHTGRLSELKDNSAY